MRAGKFQVLRFLNFFDTVEIRIPIKVNYQAHTLCGRTSGMCGLVHLNAYTLTRMKHTHTHTHSYTHTHTRTHTHTHTLHTQHFKCEKHNILNCQDQSCRGNCHHGVGE